MSLEIYSLFVVVHHYVQKINNMHGNKEILPYSGPKFVNWSSFTIIHRSQYSSKLSVSYLYHHHFLETQIALRSVASNSQSINLFCVSTSIMAELLGSVVKILTF